MNYSSLVPVLKIVMITVLALIEVAPARTGDRPVNEERLELTEVKVGTKTVEDRGVGRAPRLRLLVSSRDLGEHGYSKKLCINSG
ncbi:MAG: hypothetical protein RJA95_198 [Verrucomicrobiota bacterium]|jgi:hypothetical protein